MAKAKLLPRVDDRGILDMHVHVGPEFIRRRYSPATLAAEARDEGIGVVMKNHFQPTTAWVSMIRETDDKVPLIGAVALNLSCGGIDSHGVRGALSGWKTDTTASDPDASRFVVWMPTVCADAHLDLFQRRDMDLLWGVDPKYTTVIETGDGLRLTDPDGGMIAGLGRALAIIAEYDLVLASGHLDGEDTQLLVKTAHETGVNRIVLTHPLWQATKLKPEVLDTLFRDYGAYSELSFINLAMNGIDDLSIEEFVEVIRAVGSEGVILSSDCGQTFTPSMADSWRIYFELLQKAGISENELVQMAVVNPNKVLFDPALTPADRRSVAP